MQESELKESENTALKHDHSNMRVCLECVVRSEVKNQTKPKQQKKYLVTNMTAIYIYALKSQSIIIDRQKNRNEKKQHLRFCDTNGMSNLHITVQESAVWVL